MTSILFFCAHGRPCPNFIGFGAISAALAELFWYWRGLGGFGAAFLVLSRSRRLWRSFFGIVAVSAALAELFWYCRDFGGFGRSFFGTAAASLAYSFHWFSREKYCRKIQPHLQKFCVQDDLCRGAAVLYELRLPYTKKQAVQPPVRFFSQTAPATVCRPTDSLAPQKRRQAACSARLFAFSCRTAKAAAD